MKKKILTAAAMMLSLFGYAQTKGTNALSIGVGVSSNKNDSNIPSGSSFQEQKNDFFTLGYGRFINDNSKLGIDLLYSHNASTSSSSSQNNTTNGYGASVSYQKYYPLIGRFYAYAGGSAGFNHTKLSYDDPSNENKVNNDNYNLGAYGGITWFISKRWAFETRLLSATASYSAIDQTDGSGSGSIYKSKQTNFNLSTNGFINDLGFKIYLLF